MKGLTVPRVALHEAAHAFIAHVQGEHAGAVIFVDDCGNVEGGKAGRDDLLTEPAAPYDGATVDYGTGGLELRTLLDRAILHSAGFVAEAINRAPWNRGGILLHEHDRRACHVFARAALGITASLDEAEAFVELASQIAWTRLSREWHVVSAIAGELEKRRRLTGEQVAQIVQEARAQAEQGRTA